MPRSDTHVFDARLFFSSNQRSDPLAAESETESEFLLLATKEDKALCKKKKKTEMSIRNEIERWILAEKYNIKSQAYHGGQSNGVDAQKLMDKATDIFNDIEEYLMALPNDGQ